MKKFAIMLAVVFGLSTAFVSCRDEKDKEMGHDPSEMIEETQKANKPEMTEEEVEMKEDAIDERQEKVEDAVDEHQDKVEDAIDEHQDKMEDKVDKY